MEETKVLKELVKNYLQAEDDKAIADYECSMLTVGKPVGLDSNEYRNEHHKWFDKKFEADRELTKVKIALYDFLGMKHGFIEHLKKKGKIRDYPTIPYEPEPDPEPEEKKGEQSG